MKRKAQQVKAKALKEQAKRAAIAEDTTQSVNVSAPNEAKTDDME